MKRLAAHLLCIMSLFAMLLSDNVLQEDRALTCQADPVAQVECVSPPIHMQRACPKCFGTTFHIIVDSLQPELVLLFKCEYCGHELIVWRVPE